MHQGQLSHVEAPANFVDRIVAPDPLQSSHSRNWLPQSSQSPVKKRIKGYGTGSMPSFAVGKIGDADLTDVVLWILTK